MHPYRTHTCGELRPSHVGETARISGWVHRKRDHGNLVFVDLRDHHGLTQCVIDAASPVFPQADTLRPETVITVKGVQQGEPFKEPEFFNALLRIWLGPNPADWKLKDALLGKPA